MSAWVDQDRAGCFWWTGVTILRHAVFAGNLIVCDAARRKVGTNADFAVIVIGRMTLTAYVGAETRPRIVSNAARDGTDCRAGNGSRRASNDSSAHRTRRSARCCTLGKAAVEPISVTSTVPKIIFFIEYSSG